MSLGRRFVQRVATRLAVLLLASCDISPFSPFSFENAGTPPCNDDDDCAAREICIHEAFGLARCFDVGRCTSQADCGQDAACSTVTDPVGAPHQVCTAPPCTCNADCPGDSFCRFSGGVLAPPFTCTPAVACGGGETCPAGTTCQDVLDSPNVGGGAPCTAKKVCVP
jgi:hypothetical protein